MKADKIISNRRVYYDYELKTKLLAGLVLSGAEVSSIRCGRASLKNAFVNIHNEEAWLQNLQIFPPEHVKKEAIKEKPKKLLLTRQQLKLLMNSLKNKNSTIVVTKMILGKYIKVEIATAIGKKRFDKRETLKAKESQREIDRALKRKQYR